MMIALMLLSFMSIVSCGDDDENVELNSGDTKPGKTTSDSKFSGKWKILSIDQVDWKTWSFNENEGYIVFEKDSTYTTRKGGYHLLDLQGETRYNIQGNVVSLYNNGNRIAQFTFKSIKDNIATVELFDSEDTRVITMEKQPVYMIKECEAVLHVPTGTYFDASFYLGNKTNNKEYLIGTTTTSQHNSDSLHFFTSRTSDVYVSLSGNYAIYDYYGTDELDVEFRTMISTLRWSAFGPKGDNLANVYKWCIDNSSYTEYVKSHELLSLWKELGISQSVYDKECGRWYQKAIDLGIENADSILGAWLYNMNLYLDNTLGVGKGKYDFTEDENTLYLIHNNMDQAFSKYGVEAVNVQYILINKDGLFGVALQNGRHTVKVPVSSYSHNVTDTLECELEIKILNEVESYDDEFYTGEEVIPQTPVYSAYQVNVSIPVIVGEFSVKIYLDGKETVAGKPETWRIKKDAVLTITTYSSGRLIGSANTQISAVHGFTTQAKYYSYIGQKKLEVYTDVTVNGIVEN